MVYSTKKEDAYVYKRKRKTGLNIDDSLKEFVVQDLKKQISMNNLKYKRIKNMQWLLKNLL